MAAAPNATPDQINPWEVWTCSLLEGQDVLGNGAKIHMLGLDKQHYLCAENGGGAVNCNRLVAAQWVTSTLEVFPEGLALHVDRQRNLGLNHKPNVWVAHDAQPTRG